MNDQDAIQRQPLIPVPGALLRQIVEHTSAAVAILDREMRYIMASRCFLSDFNLAEKELIGRSHYEVFPEMPESRKEVHRRWLAGATEKGEEDSFPRADGSRDWIRWEIQPWRDDPGEIGGLILFSEVITETMRLQEAIEVSETKYRTLAENLHALVYRADPATLAATFVNRAVADIYGYSPEEWLTDSSLWERSIHPEDKERVLSEFDRALREAGTGQLEYRILRRDGATRWVSDDFGWERSSTGEIAALSGVMFDITEKKRVEEALRASEAQYRELFEQAADGIFVADAAGYLRDVNASGCAMMGYSRAEILSMHVTDMVVSGEVARLSAEVASFAVASGMRIGEWILRRKDGATFPGEVLGRKRSDGMLAGILRDLTERKALKRELLDLGERLNRWLGQELHDTIGQNIFAISLQASALATKLEKAERTEAIDASRLRESVQDLTTRTRSLVQGLFPERLDEENFAQAIERYAHEIHPRLGIRCRFESGSEIAIERPEAAFHLFRIIQEAVTNAVRHGGAREASIELARRDHLLALTIRTDGSPYRPPRRDDVGIGLRSMGLRARFLGGTFAIGPGAEGGTVVCCVLPASAV